LYWFELSRVYRLLSEPRSAVIAALTRACELAPEEERFRNALDQDTTLETAPRARKRRRRPDDKDDSGG
jgi:hypothetical protein